MTKEEFVSCIRQWQNRYSRDFVEKVQLGYDDPELDRFNQAIDRFVEFIENHV